MQYSISIIFINRFLLPLNCGCCKNGDHQQPGTLTLTVAECHSRKTSMLPPTDHCQTRLTLAPLIPLSNKRNRLTDKDRGHTNQANTDRSSFNKIKKTNLTWAWQSVGAAILKVFLPSFLTRVFRSRKKKKTFPRCGLPALMRTLDLVTKPCKRTAWYFLCQAKIVLSKHNPGSPFSWLTIHYPGANWLKSSTLTSTHNNDNSNIAALKIATGSPLCDKALGKTPCPRYTQPGAAHIYHMTIKEWIFRTPRLGTTQLKSTLARSLARWPKTMRKRDISLHLVIDYFFTQCLDKLNHVICHRIMTAKNLTINHKCRGWSRRPPLSSKCRRRFTTPLPFSNTEHVASCSSHNLIVNDTLLLSGTLTLEVYWHWTSSKCKQKYKFMW